MKTSVKILSILFFLNIFLTGCDIWGNYIKPSNNYITRNYKVKDFSKIDISTVGNICFQQSADSTRSVKIYGPDNIVALMKIGVRDGVLVLNMDKKYKLRNVKKMRISITSPSLTKISFKGVGDMLIKDSLFTNSLDVESMGVGNIEITSLICKDLKVKSVGVGNVKLKGVAQNASFMVKGIGDIEADNFKALSIEASSQGVGHISCYAVKSLSASVKGIGSIKYKGKPEKKKFFKGGVGSITSF